MSVATRQLQVRHWHEELRDLTDNLARVQARIQQLETVQPHGRLDDDDGDGEDDDDDDYDDGGDYDDDDSELALCRTIPPRSSSIPYRLPDLGLDFTDDSFRLHVDDLLNASPLEAPTAADVLSPPAMESAGEQSPPSAQPVLKPVHEQLVAHRKSHHRQQSAATTTSFDSYSTEAVQVYEASTAAMARPCVRSVASIRAGHAITPGRSEPQDEFAGRPSKSNKKKRPSTPGLFPAPLFSGRGAGPRPRQISSVSRPSSDPVAGSDLESSQRSVSSSTLARRAYNPSRMNRRPTSDTTVIRRSTAFTPSSAASSMFVMENDEPDGAACLTSSEAGSLRPSTFETYEEGQCSTPMSFRPPPWLHSTPPPSDVPHLDSSSVSISEPATPTLIRAKNSPRLKLFPKIHENSGESLGHEFQPKHAYDPFYSVCEDHPASVEPAPTPTPHHGHGSQVTNTYILPESLQQDSTSGILDRQKRDPDSRHGLVRSPRRRLRSFLRKITPTTNKGRHSMPPSSIPEKQTPTIISKRVVTPPRLPTRRGSTLPFDEALLGELTKISDRRASPSKVAPSPAKRIRGSMHDGAALPLGRAAAATHAHWRAQRSRSSILSPAQRRPRASTGSTLHTSFSSGPSFHFLPKVDQVGTCSDRRGHAMRRHRKSRH